MTNETKDILKEFRSKQRQHFDDAGKAYCQIGSTGDTMDRMLSLIDNMENDAIQQENTIEIMRQTLTHARDTAKLFNKVLSIEGIDVAKGSNDLLIYNIETIIKKK